MDEDALGLPLTAFISVKPFDPAAPDDVPDRLAGLTEVESCHSVAGEENYILKVRVATPGALESLLARIRTAANVSTRTTIVLSTPSRDAPRSPRPNPAGSARTTDMTPTTRTTDTTASTPDWTATVKLTR